MPKPRAQDYESHVQAKNASIGAEYMIHSFSGEGSTYIAADYLVVEVGLYPPEKKSVTVDGRSFFLRVNGSKRPIQAVPATLVAARFQHPEWNSGPRIQGGAGSGPADVIFGRPRSARIPGQGPTTPRPPRVPDPDPPGGITPEPRIKADELVVKTALPDGSFAGPVSGFLYFPYKGRASSIKSVELLYDDAVVKLR